MHGFSGAQGRFDGGTSKGGHFAQQRGRQGRGALFEVEGQYRGHLLTGQGRGLGAQVALVGHGGGTVGVDGFLQGDTDRTPVPDGPAGLVQFLALDLVARTKIHQVVLAVETETADPGITGGAGGILDPEEAIALEGQIKGPPRGQHRPLASIHVHRTIFHAQADLAWIDTTRNVRGRTTRAGGLGEGGGEGDARALKARC